MRRNLVRWIAILSGATTGAVPIAAAAQNCSSYQQAAANERAKAAKLSSSGTGAGGARGGQRASYEQTAAAYDNAYRQCVARQSQQAQGSQRATSGLGGYPTAGSDRAAAYQQLGQGVANLIGAWFDHAERKRAAEAERRRAEEEERRRREEEEEERRRLAELARKQRIAEMNEELEGSFAEATEGDDAVDLRAAREACKDPIARMANPRNCAWLEEQGDAAVSSGLRWVPVGGAPPAPVASPTPPEAFQPVPGEMPDGGGSDPLLAKATGPSVFPEPAWGEPPPPPLTPTALQRLDEELAADEPPPVEEARSSLQEARSSIARWFYDLPTPRQALRMVGETLVMVDDVVSAVEKKKEEWEESAKDFLRDPIAFKTEEELDQMGTVERAAYRVRMRILPIAWNPPPEAAAEFEEEMSSWHDELREDLAVRDFGEFER